MVLNTIKTAKLKKKKITVQLSRVSDKATRCDTDKLHIKLAVTHIHRILTTGQPVLGLTPQREVSGRSVKGAVSYSCLTSSQPVLKGHHLYVSGMTAKATAESPTPSRAAALPPSQRDNGSRVKEVTLWMSEQMLGHWTRHKMVEVNGA